jgi:hypothetical protein
MRYLKRALQDIRQNRFLSLVTIVTIALSILIVSAFALFFLNANDLINAWKKGVHIMVYLENDVAKTEISRLQKLLHGMVGVEEVHFISRECPSTVSLRALISFRSRNEQFSASSRKSRALRGGVLVYAAQAIPPIDAEIAEKGHLWTETRLRASAFYHVPF